MSMRGRGGEGRGRGRPRGSKNKGNPKTTPAQYPVYKPGPEVYDALFRVQKQPPLVTPTLPHECPIPNAQSSVLCRKQYPELTRYYYEVRIVYQPEATDEGGSTEPREEVAQIDMSQILDYVSAYELERYEQESYKQQSHAEAIVRQAEVDKAVKRRLEKNAREAGAGRGSRIMGGLGLANPEVPMRSRGRPSRRGQARGSGMGRGRLAAEVGQAVDTEEPQEQDLLKSAILDTSDGEEGGLHISPRFAKSAFVQGSALTKSPVLAHRRLSKPMLSRREPLTDDESDIDDDARSMSSAAAQLQFEQDVHGQKMFRSDEEDGEHGYIDDTDQHRTKRLKTERTESPSMLPAALWVKQLPAHSYSSHNARVAIKTEASSEDESPGKHTKLARRPTSKGGKAAAYSSDLYGQGYDGDTEDDDDTEEFVAEKILSHSYENGKKYYLVKWQGDEDSSDWFTREDLSGAMELVNEYEKNRNS